MKKPVLSKEPPMVALLIKAKELLEAGTEKYVCLAVLQAVYELGYSLSQDNPYKEAEGKLSKWIYRMLDRYGFLEHYLRDGKGLDIKELSKAQHMHEDTYMRQLRIRWVQWMIQELKSERLQEN